MHLRAYREKSRDESSRDFFNVPTLDAMPGPGEPPSVTKIRNVKEVSEKEKDKGQQGMEINAVLSVEGKEEVYVSSCLRWPGEKCSREGWKIVIVTAFPVFHIAR
jgi:hypothetical protein